MWSLIVKKGLPPTRLMRYCCAELKEVGGKGRMKVTGVRAAESFSRQANAGVIKVIGKPQTVLKAANELQADVDINPKGGIVMNMDNAPNRRLVERCYRTTQTMLNPIIDWTDNDVWEFLKHYGCKANPLYQCGNNRIGCIGCPMQGSKGMINDFSKYPAYKWLYIKAFDKMIVQNNHKFKYDWQNGQDVYDWWTNTDSSQISFFDNEE